jgi:hypothetical protein
MKDELKKNYLKVSLGIVAFLIIRVIISDWDHFTDGLFGL